MPANQFNTDSCGCNVIHEDIINKVKKTMPSEKQLYDLADFFKIFGDATRIKIIYALLREEMCVCDIAILLGMNQSAISHQLRTLRQAGIVKFRKKGRAVYYSLDDRHVENIFEQGLIHINHK
ncbi:MAG TPA: metalloregulator ArsR/SmtB family transcription factor [Oscillospiraceae bacterium]|nr:metalloregulator ArsR/SmtB family transcription factor [Oscillospiraceae bacterium]